MSFSSSYLVIFIIPSTYYYCHDDDDDDDNNHLSSYSISYFISQNVCNGSETAASYKQYTYWSSNNKMLKGDSLRECHLKKKEKEASDDKSRLVTLIIWEGGAIGSSNLRAHNYLSHTWKRLDFESSANARSFRHFLMTSRKWIHDTATSPQWVQLGIWHLSEK